MTKDWKKIMGNIWMEFALKLKKRYYSCKIKQSRLLVKFMLKCLIFLLSVSTYFGYFLSEPYNTLTMHKQ